jgi:hypothetical protein
MIGAATQLDPRRFIGGVYLEAGMYVYGLRCPTHPQYRAVLKPRVDCEGCQWLWGARQGNVFGLEPVQKKRRKKR